MHQATGCLLLARHLQGLPVNRTLAQYERAGELRFGILVLRANLKRDASASAPQELPAMLEGAYLHALRCAAGRGVPLGPSAEQDCSPAE